MNWFTWYLYEDEVNNYFIRFGLLLIFIMFFQGIPSPGYILYWAVVMDVIFWFVHKKPRLRKNE